MNKKIMSAALSAALLVGSLGAAGTGLAENRTFTDIEGSYAKDAIQKLLEAGIINGLGDGKFDPTGQLTRAQFAIIIAKALGLKVEGASESSTFKDVPDWASDYVGALFKAGIVTGLSTDTFGSDMPLTREQAAAIMVRALGKQPDASNESLPFKDADSISGWAKGYVAAALKLGLIKGNADGTFNPKGDATREQAAQMGAGFLQTVKENTDTGTNPGTDSKPDTDSKPQTDPPVVVVPSGDTSAPSIPQDLHEGSLTQTSLTLTWTASTDNYGVYAYDIYQDGVKIGSPTSTSFNVTGLTEGTAYLFTVKARDAAGNVSNASTALNVTTVNAAFAVTAVHIQSSNAVPTTATIGDTITLTFRTATKASKLGSFKINGGNPASFASVADNGSFLNTATYVVDSSDPLGAVSFQINVANAGNVYSQTIETTSDESSVSVTDLVPYLSIGADDITDAVGGEYFELPVTVSGVVPQADLNANFVIEATVIGDIGSDDIHIEDIEGSSPNVIAEEGGRTVYRWGGSGLPLAAFAEGFGDDDGSTTPYWVTFEKPGNYQIEFTVYVVDANGNHVRQIGTDTPMNLTVLDLTRLNIQANGMVFANYGVEFNNAVTVQGHVGSADADKKVRIYASIHKSPVEGMPYEGITSDDITIDPILGGAPEVVQEGDTSQDLVLAWGPPDGFLLSSVEAAYESDEGLTTIFPTTFKKVGTFTVKYTIKTVDDQELASSYSFVEVSAPD
ncbi:S-layer homology domain-containing protein [Paenibacillus sacheonensis]|uniref:S-layer homology domain-containing protein n=1 Tax=Paenibacillus sacheonensis TaxID=742054 RepID=A0A7X4YS85_9BACL|nr:S-layer homology domain-containing protein [Paenibacillus sacheonensis]MBM7566652.1 chitodextrinase [Paenibacillus sacheonensis]NBC70634.1 hypothetical protein [Paenibacillus sacheonensis]